MPGVNYATADEKFAALQAAGVKTVDNPAMLGKAIAEVKKLGFAEVASLDGGVQAWKAAALPLVK